MSVAQDLFRPTFRGLTPGAEPRDISPVAHSKFSRQEPRWRASFVWDNAARGRSVPLDAPNWSHRSGGPGVSDDAPPGQDSDLEALYDAHAGALYGFLFQFTRNEADARDVLQDVFIKLATTPLLLDEVRDVRGFLIRMAHRQAIDLGRRRQTRDRKHDRAAGEAEAGLFAPSTEADEAAFRGSLEAALAEIPPEQRTVVHLKLWEGMTFDQISEILQIPLNTAASRYRYGLDKLRERLRPLYDEIR